MSGSLTPYERDVLTSLLQFHVEAGVDYVLDDAAHDRFAEHEARSAAKAARAAAVVTRDPARPQPRRLAAPGEPEVHVPSPTSSSDEAVTAAAAAMDVTTLDTAMSTFAGSPSKARDARPVLSNGVICCSLLVLGEAPDVEDEAAGTAFAGREGTLLDGMLAAIGLDRTKVHVTHLVPWRQPGRRPVPTTEAALYRPFLLRRVELLAPRAVLAMGGGAVSGAVGRRLDLATVRGKPLKLDKGGGPSVVTTFALDSVLRQPLRKRSCWADLRTVASLLADGTG